MADVWLLYHFDKNYNVVISTAAVASTPINRRAAATAFIA
jgi:hypothetical protein